MCCGSNDEVENGLYGIQAEEVIEGRYRDKDQLRRYNRVVIYAPCRHVFRMSRVKLEESISNRAVGSDILSE